LCVLLRHVGRTFYKIAIDQPVHTGSRGHIMRMELLAIGVRVWTAASLFRGKLTHHLFQGVPRIVRRRSEYMKAGKTA
jgi:hypothetical protein